jgi:hypothetical protein
MAAGGHSGIWAALYHTSCRGYRGRRPRNVGLRPLATDRPRRRPRRRVGRASPLSSARLSRNDRPSSANRVAIGSSPSLARREGVQTASPGVSLG